MMILINAAKAFDKFQHLLMIIKPLPTRLLPVELYASQEVLCLFPTLFIPVVLAIRIM